MGNTYTQIYIHIVFAVKNRQKCIHGNLKTELQKFITGIVQNKGHKLIAINIMPDHAHIFVGLKPDISISDLVRDIKANSSAFINRNKRIRGKFSWQTGFGAFSHSRSNMSTVVSYINNQQMHHKKTTFQDEYISLLDRHKIEYDPRYVF